jgi:hypothetical protein
MSDTVQAIICACLSSMAVSILIIMMTLLIKL